MNKIWISNSAGWKSFWGPRLPMCDGVASEQLSVLHDFGTIYILSILKPSNFSLKVRFAYDTLIAELMRFGWLAVTQFVQHCFEIVKYFYCFHCLFFEYWVKNKSNRSELMCKYFWNVECSKYRKASPVMLAAYTFVLLKLLTKVMRELCTWILPE